MKPTVSKNNALKRKYLDSLRVVLYQIEKGNYNPHLSKGTMDKVYLKLSEAYDDLDDALGTGQEHLEYFLSNAEVALKSFKTALVQELDSVVREAEAMLSFSITCLIDALGGDKVVDLDEVSKVGYQKERLNRRLDELNDLIKDFATANSRIEKDITTIEASLDELNDKIISEDNERRINELYRQVTTINSKLDTLNVRRSNYSACYNLLDLIKVNAKEILDASEYSEVDLAKAKALLNVAKLRVVLSDPDKALNILKMMNKEILILKEKTKNIDSKIYGSNHEGVSINEDALKYKEQLLAKKRAKDTLKNLDNIEALTKGQTQVSKGE